MAAALAARFTLERKSLVTRLIKKQGNLKYALAQGDATIEEIFPGERIEIECEINCNAGVITSLDSKVSPENVTPPFVNPATGPLYVKGARKGQIIDVTIHDMTHDELGYTALWPGMGIFPDWVRQKEFGVQTRVMRVSERFVHWNDAIKLPIRPMVGVMGVAPVLGAVPTVDNGPHGGNLDVQEMTIGSTTSFVVNEDGASLYIGDCHALQGDGECAGMGALEIATNVTFSVALRDKPARMTWPRIETDTYIATLGCARPLEDAMRTAFEQMVYWLADSYGFSEAEAYIFLAQIAEARCTQMVNPKYTYICKVPKAFLPAP
jgi:acetamidase/formamidase